MSTDSQDAGNVRRDQSALPWPSHPHAEPKRYDQILQTWTYAWWRSVVGIVVVVAGFVVVVPLLMLPILLIAAARQPGDWATNVENMASLEDVTPAALLYLNLSIAGAIPIVFLVVRFLHGMRPRWLGSVVPGLRWNLLLAFLGVAAVALAASVAVGAVIPGGGAGDDVGGKLNAFTPTVAWNLLIVLLTTPLQAAGEEYVFRGYLLQAVGSFVRRSWGRWLAIGATALLFALAHGAQNVPLFFDRFAFGFVAAWLAIRTGGLEAGIAMHVLNNFLAFGAALAFGSLSESITVGDVSWWNILVTLTQSGVYAGLCVLIARRLGIQTRTAPPRPAEETLVLGVAPPNL